MNDSETVEYLRELAYERRMKDEFMRTHPESPFVAERVPGFSGLHHFPPNPGSKVTAHLVREEPPKEEFLRTNRDGHTAVRRIGVLEFNLQGQELHLAVYHAGESIGTSVFIPFRDRTSGKETYGPGRYLTLELTESESYELDFNRAFNPYCAYTDAYECGFPPAENDLAVAIRAGEMTWSSERNPRSPEDAVRRLLPGRSTPTPSHPAGQPKKGRVRARPRKETARRTPKGGARARTRH